MFHVVFSVSYGINSILFVLVRIVDPDQGCFIRFVIKITELCILSFFGRCQSFIVVVLHGRLDS